VGERSKIHHYLPQLILRGFAKDDRVVTVELKDGRRYQQRVGTAAAENNYNTIELDDGTQSDLAERLIADEIEAPASTILARIAAGGWFENDDERLLVARFLALQYVRVPWRREHSNAMADQLMKLEMAAGGPNRLREIMEAQEGRPVTDDEVRDTWKDLGDFDGWRLTMPREHHVIESLGHADEFAPALVGIYDWSVMRWEHRSILTTDSPVLLVPQEGTPQWRGVGLYTAGSIWFPVDRRTALVLGAPPNGERHDRLPLRASVTSARRLNTALVGSAHRRLYHHPDDSLSEMLGEGYELPTPMEVVTEDAHAREVRDKVRAMGEWHFEHPDQPHPMSGIPHLEVPSTSGRQTTSSTGSGIEPGPTGGDTR
jgi:hypothetical protein